MSTRAHTVPKFYLGGFLAPESEHTRDPFVWLGSVNTTAIKRRSPKNISIARGLYDGPGGLSQPNSTVEDHLAKIESEASLAISKFAATRVGEARSLPPEITRFLAWQAARTPRWMELEQYWVNDPPFDDNARPLEAPPPGFEKIRDRLRTLCLEEPGTGIRVDVKTKGEFDAYRKRGWKWVLNRDDYLEMLHVQAWYFQVRHFPRLSWVRLQPPDGEFFITSDRGVAWLVDGLADTPPAALRHWTAQVVAPLTRTVALVGRHITGALNVTPREVNRLTSCLASDWIAGPTIDVVRQALLDRTEVYRAAPPSQFVQ
ncbi:MAG: DUF4238 domain-containing protein [Candidatus Acidiferrales bacterium]